MIYTIYQVPTNLMELLHVMDLLHPGWLGQISSTWFLSLIRSELLIFFLLVILLEILSLRAGSDLWPNEISCLSPQYGLSFD